MLDFDAIFDGIVKRLIDAGEIDPDNDQWRGNPIPCDDRQIESVETSMHVKFPPAYREFLPRMGGGAGFLRGEYWYATIEDLARINNAEAWKEMGVEIEGRLFCFATRMGDVYLFFQTTDDDANPKVSYADGFVVSYPTSIPLPVKQGDMRFLDWLNSVVAEYERR